MKLIYPHAGIATQRHMATIGHEDLCRRGAPCYHGIALVELISFLGEELGTIGPYHDHFATYKLKLTGHIGQCRHRQDRQQYAG
jgi:hypothetical protein